MRDRAVGRQPQRLFEPGKCLLVAIQRMQRGAEIAVGMGQFRLQLDRTLEAGHRLLMPAEYAQHLAAIVVRPREVWLDAHRRVEIAERRRRIALQVFQMADEIADIAIAPAGAEQQPQQRLRLGVPAGLIGTMRRIEECRRIIAHGDASRQCMTRPTTDCQSCSAGCRNRRIVGYQGQSVRSSIQR